MNRSIARIAVLATLGILAASGCSNMTPQEKHLTGQIADKR